MSQEKRIRSYIFSEMKESFVSSEHHGDYADLRDVLFYDLGISDAYEVNIDEIIRSMELRD